MLKGIHHFALSTPNLSRMQAFFCELLGFTPVSQAQWPAGTQVINQIMGLDDSAAQSVMLQAGNVCVELFEFSTPTPPALQAPRPVHHYGLTHYCLDVSNIEQIYQKLVDYGIQFHCPVQDFGVSKATYGRDPDGNVFELQEVF